MKIFSRVFQILKGPGQEPEPTVSQTISEVRSVPTLEQTVKTSDNIEFLRTLRMIHKFGPSHSYGLKIFQGRLSFDGRVVCECCSARHCFDCSQLVAAKEGFSLFGCDRCKDFLIRTVNQESN